MDPERWKQIEQLCHAALERKESQRSAFLKEACGGDETLRWEVESLLAQEQEVDDFIEAPALEVVAKGLAKDQVESLLAARGGSTFSELRWYPPVEAAKGSLSWVFRAKQPESVRTGP